MAPPRAVAPACLPELGPPRKLVAWPVGLVVAPLLTVNWAQYIRGVVGPHPRLFA